MDGGAELGSSLEAILPEAAITDCIDTEPGAALPIICFNHL